MNPEVVIKKSICTTGVQLLITANAFDGIECRGCSFYFLCGGLKALRTKVYGEY